MIMHKSKEAWKYTYTIRKIRRLWTISSSLKFIVREPNKVADSIVKMVYASDGVTIFHSMSALPTIIQKLMFFDRIGLPSFSSKCN